MDFMHCDYASDFSLLSSTQRVLFLHLNGAALNFQNGYSREAGTQRRRVYCAIGARNCVCYRARVHSHWFEIVYYYWLMPLNMSPIPCTVRQQEMLLSIESQLKLHFGQMAFCRSDDANCCWLACIVPSFNFENVSKTKQFRLQKFKTQSANT